VVRVFVCNKSLKVGETCSSAFTLEVKNIFDTLLYSTFTIRPICVSEWADLCFGLGRNTRVFFSSGNNVAWARPNQHSGGTFWREPIFTFLAGKKWGRAFLAPKSHA
jgi:hypothetical protein